MSYPATCVSRSPDIAIDHPTIFAPYLASANSDTLDGIGRGEPEETSSECARHLNRKLSSRSLSEWHAQWLKDGKGMLAHKYVHYLPRHHPLIPRSSGLDAGIKLRPNEEDLKELGPEFQQRWKEYFADKPDKPVIFLCPLSMYVACCSLVFPAESDC